MLRNVPPTRDTDTKHGSHSRLSKCLWGENEWVYQLVWDGELPGVVHVVTVGKKQNLKQRKSNYIEQVALLC